MGTADRGVRNAINVGMGKMFGTIVIAVFAFWVVSAFYIARMASRHGLDFVEFLFYAVLAPPLAYGLAKMHRPHEQQRDATAKHSGDSKLFLAGLTGMRVMAVGLVVAIGVLVSQTPNAWLGRLMGHLETVAQRGAAFDACVQRTGLTQCVPTPDLSFIGTAVASISSEIGWDDSFISDSADYMLTEQAQDDGAAEERRSQSALLVEEITSAIAGGALNKSVHDDPKGKGHGELKYRKNDFAAAAAMEKEANSKTGISHWDDGGADNARVPAQSEARRSLDMVRAVQRNLAILGYEPGPVDGILGKRTTRAIKRFESARNLPVDGRLPRE